MTWSERELRQGGELPTASPVVSNRHRSSRVAGALQPIDETRADAVLDRNGIERLAVGTTVHRHDHAVSAVPAISSAARCAAENLQHPTLYQKGIGGLAKTPKSCTAETHAKVRNHGESLMLHHA